jgi:hypothetical protein
MNFVANSSVSILFFFYTHICFALIFVNCEGCGSEVRWNNKKQLLKPGGELNVMLVLLSSYGNWGLMMMHCLGYYSFLNDMPVLLSFFIWYRLVMLS